MLRDLGLVGELFRDDLLEGGTLSCSPTPPAQPIAGLDATNWRAELAIRFGVILRKVWGGSRTWACARAQAVLMSVWRTCWQQGRSALDFLSQLLRGKSVALALPPDPPRTTRCTRKARVLPPARRYHARMVSPQG